MNRNVYSRITLPILSLLLVGLISCSDDSGTDPVQTSSIKGTVVDMDSGTAVAGALVSTTPATGSTTTDANGKYELKNILPGSYSVTVTKGGYKSSTANVQVLGNTPAMLDIQLEAKSSGGGGELKKDTTIVALSFDGVNDMVVVADADDLDLSAGSFTIEAWIRPKGLKTKAEDGSNDQWNCLVSHGPNNGNLDYLMGIMDRKPMIYVQNYDAGHVGTTNLGLDRWYHLAVVQDRSSEKLYIYVDGVVESVSAAAPVGEQTLADLFIGAREADGTGLGAHFFKGIISDVRIWNVARTQADIATMRGFNLIGDEEGLVALWRMNEGEGEEIEDATEGEHVGVFSGNPTWITVQGPSVQ